MRYGVITTIFVFSSLVQLIVTLHIFRKGRRNFSYLIFSILSFVTWAWVLLNYLSIVFLHSLSLIYFVRLIMFFAVIQTALFYLFTKNFPNQHKMRLDRLLVYYGIFGIAALVVTCLPYMYRSVNVSNNTVHIEIGPALAVFVLFIVFSILSSFRVLIIRYRYFASYGLQRTQLFLLLSAAVINWIIVPITNFVLTLTFKSLIFVTISPIYGLVFSSIIGYALVKHYLFNNERSIRDSVIHLSYYLKNKNKRSLEYYILQSAVENSSSKHLALDFSNVKKLDDGSLALLTKLSKYTRDQGKNLYFIRCSKDIFKQLKLSGFF